MSKEYGYARTFVVANAEYIAEELKKYRTAKSIWQEIVKNKGIPIPYRSFLYNVNIQITNNHGINVHMKKQAKNRNQDTNNNQSFKFNNKINSEDMI